jgi:uncharacterized protein (DUF433 family)
MVPESPPAPTVTRTPYAHIILREDGVPIIEGTTTKVIEVVVEKLKVGSSAEELHRQHPYLSLGQIYSALAYYADHAEALESAIVRSYHLTQEMRRQTGESPIAARLKAEGLLK